MHTLDAISSDLHRQGIGAQRKHASVITVDDENFLWSRENFVMHHQECYNIQYFSTVVFSFV